MKPSSDSRPTEFVRLRALDSMRGIAALIVMGGHVFWLSPLGGERHQLELPLRVAGSLAARLLDGGAAVFFFFVLSGFVLALPYVGAVQRRLDVAEFVVRRVLRIMPTYWAATAVGLGLRALASGLPPVPRMPVDWSASLGPAELFDIVSLVFGSPERYVNGPMWSLQVEMRMSLLLPFFIAAAMLRPGPVSGLVTLAIALLVPFVAPDAAWLLFGPLFVFGVLLARWAPEATARLRSLSPAARALLVVAGLALFYNRSLEELWELPRVFESWLAGLGSGLMILLVLAETETPWFLGNRVASFFGDISYSLFAVHQPVLVAVALVGQAQGWSAVRVALTGICLAFVAATLLHRLVEAPSMRWSRVIVRRRFADR
jgi:peptidoglycan/LPS O-acetylase OafA/YrhL